MVGNKNLHKAKKDKKDEFYTQMPDIANELKHYKKHFQGKVVFCNCDDPYESNFFKFFALNFNAWGLKKLICTCYDQSLIAGEELPLFDDEPKSKRRAYKIELTQVTDINGDGATDLLDVQEILRRNKPEILKQDGDFRSKECIEILKESDIIVTNPPFSLFREYIGQLIKYKKQFLIIGHQNAIKYKEVFPLLVSNEIWLGYGFKGGAGHFISHYKDVASAGDHIEGMIRVSGVMWFTNLEIPKRHEELDLYKEYNENDYPTYDNYNAIEVSRTADVPFDYDGIMGVPLTFMDKYCPEQFEILGCTQRGSHDLVPDHRKYNDYSEYLRATNEKTGSSGNKTNENAVLLGKGTKKTYFMNEKGRIVHSEYDRIFIRKR